MSGSPRGIERASEEWDGRLAQTLALGSAGLSALRSAVLSALAIRRVATSRVWGSEWNELEKVRMLLGWDA